MVTKVLFYILFALAMGISAALGWTLYSTNLLPRQLVVVAVGLLILLPMLLFLMQKEKKRGPKKLGARIAAIVLLLFLCIVEGTGLYFFNLTNRTLNRVTAGNTQVTVVQVYVKEGDRATTIEYAVESEYRFGTLAYADTDAIAEAQAELEQNYGRKIRLVKFNSLLDLIRALDEDEVDALLISSAYVELIDSLEGYEHYAESLQVLHTSDIKTEIQPQPEPVNEEIDEETAGVLRSPDLWENSFCAYISGIDTFGPVATRSRSDVNILAIVNTETKTVLLVSTPRDYYVPFNFVGGALDKLTHSGIYGIEASMQALGDYYGIPVTYYLRVNFSGFIDVIDTLGGVDVESDADFAYGGYYYQKGMNHLNGRAALGFVRNRKSFLEGDRARGRHQMAVIKGVINALASSKLIANYAEIMDEMSGSFQTNVPKKMIGELAQLTLDLNKGDWTVLTYSVDGWGKTDYAYSLGCNAYVMVPYPDTVDYARELVIAVASGEALTQQQISENAPKH